MAKATTWTDTDTEVRSVGANRLDTLVVHAVNAMSTAVGSLRSLVAQLTR